MLEPDLLCSPLLPFGRGVGGEGCATLELQLASSDLLHSTGFLIEYESIEACLTPTRKVRLARAGKRFTVCVRARRLR